MKTGPLLEAAGLFKEEADGGVTVTVSPDFFTKREAACAILCHELAHYVLNANGIREANRVANERLTDVAIFVLGLGDIFLAGYSMPAAANRPGHRLGYLTAAEYEFVDKLVFQLHLTGELQRTHVAEMESRFRSAVPEPSVRKRLVAAERSRHPSLSGSDLIERILDRYTSDRGR